MFRYFVYSQGAPLIIVLLTLVVDEVGQAQDDNTVNKQLLPNMGIYGCFFWKRTRYRFLVPIADWDNVPRDNVPRDNVPM